MNNAAQIVIVLVGVLVPVAFVLFEFSITRRGREPEKMDGLLLSTIAQLHDELHRAFASEKEQIRSKEAGIENEF